MLPPALPAHIDTERYRLDQLQRADAPALLTHFADPDVTRYLDFDPLADLAEARAIIDWAEGLARDRVGGRWAIRARDAGVWLGTAGFNAITRTRASRGEIAYDLAREWWGRGVMREVLPVLLGVGFVDLDLNRLEAFVTPGNEPSARLLTRHSFRQEGLLRAYGRWRGRDWDQELWSLLRADWTASHGP